MQRYIHPIIINTFLFSCTTKKTIHEKFCSTVFCFSFYVGLYSGSTNPAERTLRPQPLPILVDTHVITYIEVVHVNGVQDSVMYSRGMKWINTYYKNPKDVIQKTDGLRGTIDGKARFKIYNPPDKKGLRTDAGNVEYSIQLGCKTGKYKYTITDLNWKQTSYYPIERWQDTTALSYNKVYLYYLEQTDSLVHEITKNLEAFMKTSPAQKKDDW
jgi:hypothetical protein